MSFQIYHPEDLLSHPSLHDGPERVHRLLSVMDGITSIDSDRVEYVTAKAAYISDALTLHSYEYIEKLLSPIQPDGATRFLDADTQQGPDTLDAALTAVGGAQNAINALADGTAQGAFLAARPPGHHATKDGAMGFCVLGTGALAAKYAEKTYGWRVAVLDFDVHNGNGYADLLSDQKNILYASSHQKDIYPFTGTEAIDGTYKQISNHLLPKGSDGEYALKVWDDILKRVKKFKPDLIIVAAGFDAHTDDPLGGLNWSIHDYKRLAEKIQTLANKVCKGRVLSILEGGYDLNVLHKAVPLYLQPYITAAKRSHEPSTPGQSILDQLNGHHNAPYLINSDTVLKDENGETFKCVKRFQRLWIQDQTTGRMMYTPPHFMMMTDRKAMQDLALKANAAGCLSIKDIIEFENSQGRKYAFNQRVSADFK